MALSNFYTTTRPRALDHLRSRILAGMEGRNAHDSSSSRDTAIRSDALEMRASPEAEHAASSGESTGYRLPLRQPLRWLLSQPGGLWLELEGCGRWPAVGVCGGGSQAAWRRWQRRGRARGPGGQGN